MTEVDRRRMLVVLGGALVTGCSQRSEQSSSSASCTTGGKGPGVNYCLIEKKQIRVPKAAKLILGEVLLMAADDRNAVIVARDQNGLFALSAICTHACCTVALCGDAACGAPIVSPTDCGAPARGKSVSGAATFLCPCHGSQFGGNGKVLSGPATVDLPSLHLEIVGEDAIVDLSMPVANTERT